jgi:hypothetical protein
VWKIEREWGRLGGTRWTRVPWQSSRRIYRAGRCRPRRRDGGSGRDASASGTLSWAQILALRLPVDAFEIRTTSWRSTGARRWSSMAAGTWPRRCHVARAEEEEEDFFFSPRPKRYPRPVGSKAELLGRLGGLRSR